MIKQNNINQKDIRNFFFMLFLSVIFCQDTLFSYVQIVIGKLPFISILAPFFFPLIYFILFLLSSKSSRYEKLRIYDLFFILLFVIFIAGNCLFSPENEQFISKAFISIFLPCILFFLLGICFDLPDEKMSVSIAKFSCLAILVSTAYVFYYLGSGRGLAGEHGENYSMYWAYLLLPNILIVINYSFKSKKIIPIICSIVGIFYIFGMGTRGAFLIIFVFLLISLWRNIKMSTFPKILLSILIFSFIGIFILSPLYTQTLLALKNFLLDMGVSSRIVDYLLNGELISYTSGRDVIYKDLLERLSLQPIFGYGIMGEYQFGYESGAHNIFLQIVFNFGYPLGILFIGAYVFIFIKALIQTKGSFFQDWIIIFGCLVFIKGIFGGSYLSTDFFFLLGLCLSKIRKKKNKFIISKEVNTRYERRKYI